MHSGDSEKWVLLLILPLNFFCSSPLPHAQYCRHNLRPHYLTIFTYTESPTQANSCLVRTNLSSTFLTELSFWVTNLSYYSALESCTPVKQLFQSGVQMTCNFQTELWWFTLGNLLVPLSDVTWNAPATALCLSNTYLFIFKLKMFAATFLVPDAFLGSCYFSWRNGAYYFSF